MCVFVRWNNQLGTKVPVRKGMRQGGLTSLYLHNLFYKTLIDELNNNVTGVVIGDISNCYNAFWLQQPVQNPTRDNTNILWNTPNVAKGCT